MPAQRQNNKQQQDQESAAEQVEYGFQKLSSATDE